MFARISTNRSKDLSTLDPITKNFIIINEPPSKCDLLCNKIVEVGCAAICGEPEWWFYISCITQVALYTTGLPLTIATYKNHSSALTVGILLLSSAGSLTLFNIIKSCCKASRYSNEETTPLMKKSEIIEV